MLKEAANKTSKEIGEHVDTVTNQMDHSMETLETNIKVAQAPIEETLKSLDATQTIETLLGVTGIVSQLGFILNNVANAWDAVTDPDVSGWDKLKVVSGALVSSLSMYLTMASSLKSLLPQIATQLGVNVVAEAALNAEKAKGNILTKDQITNEMMLSAAKKMSVKDLLKETIATAAATAAKWLHAAAQAVLNLLQGNFTALGVAAAAALVAIAGAAIYGVAQLIKYNSEQEQLNRTVERSSEALNKAQEKFQTLQDTLSGYKDATSQMEGLTEGTVEFYNALIEANERALELIDSLGLVAGVDYGVGPNGQIVIKEEALEDAMYDKQREVFRAQGAKASAKYDLTAFERDETVSNFQHSINKKSGFGIGLDRETSEKILADTLPETEVHKGIYNAHADTSGWNDVYTVLEGTADKLGTVGGIITALAGPAGLMTAGGIAGYEVMQQGFSDGVTDITQEVGQFRGEYNAKTAEMLALERQMADSFIRAYGDKESLKVYNSANNKQKEMMQNYVVKKVNTQKAINQNATRNDNGWNDFFDVSDDNWWGKIWKGSTSFGLNLLTGGVHWGQQAVAQTQGPSNMELKEMYAKNVLGYTQDKDGNWKDSSGKKVKEKEIREIDLDTARDAYNTGEYASEEATQDITKILSQSKETSANNKFGSDSQDYIGEAVLAYMTGDTSYDFSQLTDEERKEAERQITQDLATLGGNETQEQKDVKTALAGSKHDDTKRRIEDSKRFDETLESEAASVGASTDALRLYALAQEKAAKSTKNLSSATAKNAAASYKFNKAYNEGRDAFADNTDAWKAYVDSLKTGKEISYDVEDGAGEIVSSLREMGINLSNEQLQDPASLEKIKTLFTGTKEEAKKAYEVLRDQSWLNDLTNNFGMAETAAKSFISTLKSAKLDSPIDTTLLQQSFGDTKKTLEDWQKWAEQYGLEVDVKTPSTEVDQEVIQPEPTVTKHVISAHKKGDEEIPAYEYTETVYPAPQTLYGIGDLKLTKVSHGGGNFTPGGGSTSKGSKSKKESKIDDKKDRYHDVNIELKQIANELEKAKEEQDYLAGTELIENLQRQYNLLNKEIAKTAEKIGIARGEQEELQNELSGYGVTFNADGTIANYAEAWDNQLSYVNSIIDRYNELDDAGKEKYQDTLNKAKEDWEKFKESIDRYDTLITDDIPQLEADVRDALAQQIEIKLEAFEYKIEIQLDLADAEREWNKFKTRILDGIKEDDILGNAQAKLKDFNTYYNENGTGEIQATTSHVNEILNQLKQMDADQIAGIYGETYTYTNALGEQVTVDFNNRKQALEDLKEYYSKLMDSMTDLQDKIEEIKESYLDMMDEAQEKFDEQKETFEAINDMINHQMNVTSLVFGEDAYDALAEYYKAQSENNTNQLAFQEQQIDFWRQQMLAAEEGSEQWEKARDNWEKSISDWKAISEKNIQDIIAEYTNGVNLIFQNLNDKVTGGVGLSYASKEWSLINQEADRYLDSINGIYQTQSLQNKYLDAIEQSSDPTTQKKLNDLMEDELALLREKDKLSQYDIDRANMRYDIAMKQIALEEAQQNKTQLRLRRDSQGNYRYQYTADESEVSKLQQELSDLYNQLYNLDVGKYKENLDELYNVWEQFNADMYEASLINDPEEKARQELLIKEKYGNIINDIVADNEAIQKNLHESTLSELFDLYDQNKVNYEAMTEEQKAILDQFLNVDTANLNGAAYDNLFNIYNANTAAFEGMTQQQLDILTGSFIPQLESEYQKIADFIRGEGGFVPTCQEAFDQLQNLGEDYLERLNAAYAAYKEKADQVQQETQDLVKDNTALFNSYQQQLAAVQAVIDELEKLVLAYDEAAESARKAAIEAKEYWTAAQNQNANTDTSIKNEAPKPTGTLHEEEEIGNDPPKTPTLSQGMSIKIKSSATNFSRDGGNGTRMAKWVPGSSFTVAQWDNDEVLLKSGSSYLGWVWKKDLQGFKTGGYTGDWNSSNGKLAMLHEKELVLNANDTKNILNAVGILRGVTRSLGQALMNQMANISANNTSAIAGGLNSNGLEQNVHIDAQFPNVVNSNEIETALNNLVNMASQHIQKN